MNRDESVKFFGILLILCSVGITEEWFWADADLRCDQERSIIAGGQERGEKQPEATRLSPKDSPESFPEMPSTVAG